MNPALERYWSKSGAPILALVSGLPKGRRNEQLLLMLQLFIDESSTNDPPVYVMSGVISTAERWAKFSDEWQAALDMPVRLKYFKMSEAMGPGGEFQGFSESRRNERLQIFADIIGEHAFGMVSCCLPHDVHKKMLTHPGVPKHLRNPYCFLFYGMVLETQRLREVLKLGDGDMDLIFDDLIGAKDQALNGFEQIRKLVPRISTPTFRDDMKVLPLQAADMIAWTIRKKWEHNFVWDNAPRKPQWDPPFGLRKPLTSIELPWTTEMLFQFLGRILGETGRGSYTMTINHADGSKEIIKGGHQPEQKDTKT
jgi:Protein of unknown function (DUF3800)